MNGLQPSSVKRKFLLMLLLLLSTVVTTASTTAESDTDVMEYSGCLTCTMSHV